MSLIGGYFNFNNTVLEDNFLLSKLKSFKCIPNEQEEEYDISISQFQYGHLFSKSKKNIRSMTSMVSDSIGNCFVSLGYLNLNDWKNWNSTEGKLEIEPKMFSGFPNKLIEAEGEFTSIYFSNSDRCLHIINDRFAARPFYYLQTQNTLYFCSNIIFLMYLCHYEPVFDPCGLLQLFLYSHTIGTDTHISGIERLYPATHMTISEQEVSSKHYWKLEYAPRHDLNPQDFAHKTFSAFKEGVGKRANMIKRGYLHLSGGLDSRLIAGTLSEHIEFPFLTFEFPGTLGRYECTVASEIAQLLDHRYIEYKLKTGIISEQSETLIMLTGGLMPLPHAVKPIYILPGYDMHMSGSPGDVLVGSYIPRPHYALPERLNTIVQRLTKIQDLNILEHIFSKHLLSDVIPKFETKLRESFDRVMGPTAAHTLSAWKMVYRQPAFTLSNPHHCHPCSTQIRPHLDYAYNDLILQLPAAWLFNKQFYEYMIYRCLPELRHVPYANTGKPLNGRIGKPVYSLINCKSYTLRQRLKKLIKQKQAFAVSPELQMLQQDKKLLDDMLEIITSYPYLNEFLSVDNCVELIRRAKNDSLEKYELSKPENALGFLATILYFYKIAKQIL
jgi:hypothetical protein